MEYVFIGEPCEREIELYLENRKQHLLDNVRLMNGKSSFGGKGVSKDGQKYCGGNGNQREPFSEKDINKVHKNDATQNKKSAIKNETQKMRMLVDKNTSVNAGYKYVKLLFRDRVQYEGEITDECFCSRERKRQVKFSNRPPKNIHNTGEPHPILLLYDKPLKIPKRRSKEIICVRSLASFQDNLETNNFKFRYII